MQSCVESFTLALDPSSKIKKQVAFEKLDESNFESSSNVDPEKIEAQVDDLLQLYSAYHKKSIIIETEIQNILSCITSLKSF